MSFRPAACKIAEETGCDSEPCERRFPLFGQEPQLVATVATRWRSRSCQARTGFPLALMLDQGGDGDIAACGADIADRPRERHRLELARWRHAVGGRQQAVDPQAFGDGEIGLGGAAQRLAVTVAICMISGTRVMSDSSATFLGKLCRHAFR